jgi:hypothetical protein
MKRSMRVDRKPRRPVQARHRHPVGLIAAASPLIEAHPTV